MQLTQKEIEDCEKDAGKRLQIKALAPYKPTKKQGYKKYIPIIHRKNKPNAILWLVANYPNIKDSIIQKLIGTTKSTIHKIREKTYSGYKELVPKNPVSLNLCSKEDLEDIIKKIEAKTVHQNSQQEN